MKFYIYEDKNRLGNRQPCTLRYVEADTAEAAIVAWMAQQPRADWRPTSALVIPEHRNFGRPHFTEEPNDRFYVYADPTVDAEEICAESYMVGNCMEFYGFQLCGMGWVKSESSVHASLWKHNMHGWCWWIGYRPGETNGRFAGSHLSSNFRDAHRSSIAALADMQEQVMSLYVSSIGTMAATRTKPLVHLTAALCVTRKDRAQSWIPSADEHAWTRPVQDGEENTATIFHSEKGWCWSILLVVLVSGKPTDSDAPPVAGGEGHPDPLEAESAWRRHQTSLSTKTMMEMSVESRSGISVTPMPQSAMSPFELAGVEPTQRGGRPPALAEAPEQLPATGGDGDADDDEEPETTERCEGCPDKPAATHDDHMIPLCEDCYNLLEPVKDENDGEREGDEGAEIGTEKDAAPTTLQ